MLGTVRGFVFMLVNKTDVVCSYGTVRLLGRVLSKNILSDYEAKKVNEEHSRQTK